MITRLFWSLFVLEAVALTGFLVSAAGQTKRSPEGPVGAWILGVPPLVMLITGVVFHLSSSNPVKWTCFAVLAYPLLVLAAGPLVRTYKEYRVERAVAGDEHFPNGPLREIAHGVRAGDLERVRAALPAAGDLNRQHNGETLLRFAVANTKRTDIVRTLLQAGADPNYAAFDGDVPLTMAFYEGRPMVGLLLNAGADPNRTDGAGRPIWWQVLSNHGEETMGILDLLAQHGVDLQLRDGESGPVGWASYHRNWPAVWWLMEHGAEWRGEQRYGSTALSMLEQDIASKEASAQPVQPEARLALARLREP